MKIIISGPAEAFLLDTDEQITEPSQLEKLDGLPYSKDQCSNYIDVSLQDIGVIGGVIQLAFDGKAKRLRAVTEYHAPRKLTAEELKLLVEETTGQWSDGIGEGEFLHRKKLKMDVGLTPVGSTKVCVEQVDDGKKVETPRIDALIMAIRDGKSAEAKRLIADGADVNGKDRDGSTPLHFACLSGQTDLALLLLDRDANVSAVNKTKQTPLAYLAMSSDAKPAANLGVAKVLLEKGALIDARDKEGLTPLMLAVNRGKLALVQLLVDAGADVNAKDRQKYNESTVIMYAQRCDVAELLLKHGADPSVCNAGGETAWEYALINNHIRGYRQLAELLQSHGQKRK